MPLIGTAHPTGDTVAAFLVGEDLVYNVSYAGINIGQIRVRVTGAAGAGSAVRTAARVSMDSYDGIPFVDLHAVYEDTMAAPCHSAWFRSRTKKDGQWYMSTYRFDYPSRRLVLEHGLWKSDRVHDRDTLRVDTLQQDGLSLFFFARRSMIPGSRWAVPTVVSERQGVTTLSVDARRTAEKIDAVAYPIAVQHAEGEAGFVGVFGFTGHFEGWFSDDPARVPILAKLKVLIGTIRVELMQWRRDGWQPPRAREGE